MQDRFKFRVFDKENGEMFYPTKEDEHIEIDANGDLIGIDLEGLWCGGLNCTLMQCTGLKDKNGKLIYEGDIVKDLIIPEHPYIVEWFKGGFSLKSTISNSFLKFDTTQQEVIGNIYENPELLKDGE